MGNELTVGYIVKHTNNQTLYGVWLAGHIHEMELVSEETFNDIKEEAEIRGIVVRPYN